MRLLVALILLTAPALAQNPRDLTVQIVDVGPAHCSIIKIPDGPDQWRYMIYDAGHWTGHNCRDAARAIIGLNKIDLMVISHSDADHLGEAQVILEEFTVGTILRTGIKRPRKPRATKPNTWEKYHAQVAAEVTDENALDLNLQNSSFAIGQSLTIGDASITMVAGWPNWDDNSTWTVPADNLSDSEKMNAPSIVIRLEYEGMSILFTGDTVGKRLKDDDTACKAAEKFMVDKAALRPIKSDVLIAPHHGANNGSAACFIAEVDPDFVIFPAGHKHGHPAHFTVQRYLDSGLKTLHLFSTDRGDREGYDWIPGHPPVKDGKGDDDVLITLKPGQPPKVEYKKIY